MQHLREPDGSYWTGWQFANQAPFPRERSSWTSAAVVLAADALAGFTGGAGIFRDAADERRASPATDRVRGEPAGRAREPNGPGGQPMPSPVRSSRRSEPSPGTSVNAPDFSARW